MGAYKDVKKRENLMQEIFCYEPNHAKGFAGRPQVFSLLVHMAGVSDICRCLLRKLRLKKVYFLFSLIDFHM